LLCFSSACIAVSFSNSVAWIFVMFIFLHVHPLLGNGLVNKFSRFLVNSPFARLRNSRECCVFYVIRATPSAGNGPMNSQSDTWHVFSVGYVPKNYKRFQNNRKKSATPPFLSKEEQRKKKKNKSLDTEQIYGHGSQQGSMLGVTVLAGCRQ
jgi:hypothetical protein